MSAQFSDRTTLSFVVSADDTARALGSGSLDVLGTPRLLAWAEATTCALLAGSLKDGETSVGTRMSLEHLRASPVGAAVEVEAVLAHRDGRLVRFDVVASHQDGTQVAVGEVTRVVVDGERFLSRLR